MASIMSSRLAAELDHAFERNGWSAQEVKLLSSGKLLTKVRNVVLGHAEIKITPHIIDCDVDPFVPDGWKVEEHRKGGQLSFDATQVQLFLAEGQQNGNFMEGFELWGELAGKPVLNANVLDYLLAHPEPIPEDWKRKNVFFWGTIDRSPDDLLYVRYLFWDSNKWDWSNYGLDQAWYANDPVVVRIG